MGTDGGIADNDVESAEFLLGGRYHLRHCFWVANVGKVGQACGTDGFDFGHRLLKSGYIVMPIDNNSRARAGKLDRDRLADVAARASHKSDLSAQVEGNRLSHSMHLQVRTP